MLQFTSPTAELRQGSKLCQKTFICNFWCFLLPFRSRVLTPTRAQWYYLTIIRLNLHLSGTSSMLNETLPVVCSTSCGRCLRMYSGRSSSRRKLTTNSNLWEHEHVLDKISVPQSSLTGVISELSVIARGFTSSWRGRWQHLLLFKRLLSCNPIVYSGRNKILFAK